MSGGKEDSVNQPMSLRQIIRQNIPNGSLVRGVSVIASGTVMGQIIQVLATPILTRIYSPNEFGELGVFVGLLVPITVIACLRFEMAIPLPKRDGAAFQIVGLALLSLIIMTALTTIMGLGFGKYLLGKVSNGVLSGIYWLLPIGVFLGGLYQLSSLWAIRKKAFSVIATTRVQQGVGAVAIQAGLGALSFGTVGLAAGQVAGQALGLQRLTGNLIKDYRKNLGKIGWRGVKWALKRYSRFLKYDTFAALLNNSGAQVPAILLAVYFSPAMAGAYILSVRIFSAPITLIGKALIQAMLPDVVNARHSGQLPSMVQKIRMVLSAVSLGPFMTVALLMPLLFGHLFGNKWEGAGFVAAWTAVWVGFQFTYSPLSVVLLAVEAQKMNLVLQVISFLTRIVSIYVCYAINMPKLVISIYSVTSAMFYLIATICVEWRSGRAFGESLRGMALSLISGIIVTLPTAASLEWRETIYGGGIGAIASCFVWAMYLRWTLRRAKFL